jgi:cellulose synthase/poly-beta-1,6-N-acetylglucosamine synthase-like glycosyltransferase
MQMVTDKELPTYTILIPVFHEAEILAQNLKNMYNLNYPKDKLDIKILMEEKDEETINEAKMLGLFGSPQKKVDGISGSEYTEFLKLFDPIIIPSAQITTKPRACNYGLLRAKGEFVVIYDAEDNPDPDQLKKAAIAFLRSNDNLACLQSKLNFYNANENILTKWFSIEYANWFEFYLQGLDYINAPIPLGGTSNHFRKKSLDELGRWDPYNVTEDADIGIRLARYKMKTEMIDSYTYEEATVNVKSWIRQRSRWYKGHLQTYLVHMRYPRKLLKELGTEQFLKFQLTFGAAIFMPIINPVLWMLTAIGFLMPLAFAGLLPNYVQWICLFNFIVGNLSYLLLYVIACVKLKKYRLTPFAILMPAYWALLSIASWRGLIQLIRKPFYWDKTSHGVSKATKSIS